MFYNRLNQIFEKNKDSLFLSEYDGESERCYTFGEFKQTVLGRAAYLQQAGIRGRRIALLGENSADFLVSFFALIASGNTVIPVNNNLKENEKTDVLKRADAEYVCLSDTVLSPDANAYKILSFDNTLLKYDPALGPDGSDIVLMLSTSGTTGQSKLAQFDINNLLACAENNISIEEKYMPGRCLLLFSLSHMAGIMQVLFYLFAGKTIIIGRGPKYVFNDCKILKPKAVWFVPSLADSITQMMALRGDKIQNYLGPEIETLLLTGAKPNINSCRKLLAENINVLSVYGMTELTGLCFVGVVNNSCSELSAALSASFRADLDEGEIILCGSGVFRGYYKNPEESARVIRDGWLYTGDLGKCDENGKYTVVGRKKNIIILSNGENVNPEEIEAKLRDCADVLECVVCGINDSLCTFIYTKNEEAVKAYIKKYNAGSASFRKINRSVFYNEELKKGPSGKIDRKYYEQS